MNGELILGMLAAFAASAAYNVAIALQAFEARDVPEEHGLRLSLLLQLLRRPRWLAGAGLNFLGWPLQTVALLLAPLTLVQPCLAAGLLLLLAIGSRHLHEHVGRREVIAIAGIIAGVVLLAVAAPHRSETAAGPDTIAVVLGILGAIAVLPYALSRFRRTTGLPVAISAGLAFAWSGISTKLMADSLSTGDWLGILSWAAATGLAAGLGTASEMTALQSRGATEVAPLVFVTQLLVPALLAPILVHESWDSTPLGGLVLLIGLLIVSAGSFLLASSRIVQAVTTAAERSAAAEPGTAAASAKQRLDADETASASGERASEITTTT